MHDNWLISVDDHVIEPPNVWVDRVPAKLRDAAPHVVRSDGFDYWVYADKVVPLTTMPGIPSPLSYSDDGTWPGKSPAEMVGHKARNYDEINPVVYDPIARTKIMDQDHVLASMCFPTVVRFAGQLFWETTDHEHRLTFVKAYNDWMIDEWAGSAPGRLIPLIILPLWDPPEAAKEIERCAAKGARAFSFPENPAPLGLPTIHRADRYWDPVLQAANDTGLLLCQHIGSSSRMLSTSDEANLLVTMAWAPVVNISGAFVDWMLSDTFHRFDNLKVVLSEGNIGWIPYMLERITRKYDRSWKKRQLKPGEENPKVDFFKMMREHVYGCVVDDRFGLKNLDFIGEDNVMLETDFPHGDSYFPNSLQNAMEQFEPLTEEQRVKIMRGNAQRLLRWETPEQIEIDLGDLAGRREKVLSTIVTDPTFDEDGFWKAQQEELQAAGGSRLLGAQMETNAEGLAWMKIHN